MREIPLTQGKVALVDDEDFEILSHYKWHARKIRGKFYAGRGEYLGKTKEGTYKTICVHMHRQIMGIDDINTQIDHKNGDGLDNRRDNLRLASPNENRRNLSKLKKNNSSGFRGVIKRKDSKNGEIWRARIAGPDGRKKSLGQFTSPEEAARAFDRAAKELYGSFCGKLNFE